MWHDIIQLNYVTLVAIMFSLISFIKNRNLDKKIRQLYIGTSIIIIILMIVDTFDYYFESLDNLNWFRYITSSIGYSLRPVGLLLIIFTILRFNYNKTKVWIISIPALINVFIYIVNLGFHWAFEFDQANNFIRHPLWVTPFVIGGIYLVTLTVLAVKRHRFVEDMEFVLVLVIGVAIVISVILESVLRLRCLVNGVAILSANCYFLYLNTQTFSRDELTNLLNRRAFFSGINKLSGKIYIVCIDMNDLKGINDKEGHIAGDNALKTIAKALIDNTNQNDKVYRVGGDEFVVLSKCEENELLQRFEKVNKIIEENGLSIAFGYELFDSTIEFEKIYNKADEKMYECKRKMKELKNIKNINQL